MKIRMRIPAFLAALALLGGCSDNEYGEAEDGVPSPGEAPAATVEQDVTGSPVEDGTAEEEEFGSGVGGVMGTDADTLAEVP